MNFSLKTKNTFRIDSYCRELIEIHQENILSSLNSSSKKLILGGGSNIILPDYFDGVVLNLQTKGIDVQSFNESYLIKVKAGEIWSDFVLWTLENNIPGFENLSHIPGTVGAAPVQNIGAYGVEIAELIDSIICWSFEENRKVEIFKKDCNFSYRSSIFKDYSSPYTPRLLILEVNFKIKKNWKPNLNYFSNPEKLFRIPLSEITPKFLANTIINIRKSKIPDPINHPNVGSFFKNPIISLEKSIALKKNYKEIPIFQIEKNNSEVKVSAGWLISQCNINWESRKPLSIWPTNALIVVNHGGGSIEDVTSFSEEIINSVLAKFGIKLEIEPSIVN